MKAQEEEEMQLALALSLSEEESNKVCGRLKFESKVSLPDLFDLKISLKNCGGVHFEESYEY